MARPKPATIAQMLASAFAAGQREDKLALERLCKERPELEGRMITDFQRGAWLASGRREVK